MHLVLLGPPGGGKGTQTEYLRSRLGLVHVASGDLFRDRLDRETALGLRAKSYMDRGMLVPDDVTIGMVAGAVPGVRHPARHARTEALADSYARRPLLVRFRAPPLPLTSFAAIVVALERLHAVPAPGGS